jgi:hypothetical protein|tara:strand:+ start:1079 stop:1504 length:426 start_codon:yes stop_codon:yes gene_type:complete
MDILVQKFLNVNTHYNVLSNKDKLLVSLFFSKDNIEYVKLESFKIVNKPLGNTYLEDNFNQQLDLMLKVYTTTDTSKMEMEQQLIHLNRKFVQRYVDKLNDEIKFYKDYEKHASSLPIPLGLPKNEHKKGLNNIQEKGYLI